jgi:nitrogen fixation protein
MVPHMGWELNFKSLPQKTPTRNVPAGAFFFDGAYLAA